MTQETIKSAAIIFLEGEVRRLSAELDEIKEGRATKRLEQGLLGAMLNSVFGTDRSRIAWFGLGIMVSLLVESTILPFAR